jgi:alpha-1,6-mannosyltransferase
MQFAARTAMHIADATLFFAARSGGVRRYLECKHRYLTSVRGVRHSLVVPGPVDTVRHGIVEIAAPRLPMAGGYRLPLRLAAWRDALCGLGPDLIEVADPYHLAWASLAAAERLGVPAVAFAHSHLSRLLACRFGRVVGWAADAYLRELYMRFDVVLAPSETVAAHLRSTGIGNVEVQPLGVDADVFHPRERDPDLRTLLGLPARTRLLAFAGRMAREKEIPLLCRTVESLGAPYHLLLIGARECRRVSACVTELPFQRNARRLARLLASSDALLHAGQQETFGLVVIEAMACGRPVIGIRAGAVAELIDPAVGRLADTGTVGSLASAIRDLFEADPEMLGAAARQRVERVFTWDRVFGAQLARYERLAQVHIAGAPLLAEQTP